MSLIYTLVSKDPDIVLCSFSECQGNFELMCQKLLKKVQKNTRGTFAHDKYMFHFLNTNDFTFMAFCEKGYDVNLGFDFLEKIKSLFFNKYSDSELESVIRYSLNDSFHPILMEQMKYYNDNVNIKTKVDELKQCVIEQKNIIIEANEALMERGDKLNIIVKKAEQLTNDSNSFYRAAKKVKRNEQCKRIKWIIIITSGVLVVAYVIAAIVCKGPHLPICIGSSEKQ